MRFLPEDRNSLVIAQGLTVPADGPAPVVARGDSRPVTACGRAVRPPSDARAPLSGNEWELLLLTLQADPTQQARVRLRELSAGDLNWAGLMAIARSHGVLVHLGRGLQAAAPTATPAEVLAQLHQHTRAVHRRSVYLTAQLLKLLGCLRERGIATMAVKGPVLAALAFEDLGRREFVDLDVLVRRCDLPMAREALLAENYQLRLDVGRSQEAAYVDSVGQLQFLRDDGVLVEVHSSLLRREFGVRLEEESLWERVRQVSLLGQDVPTLAAAEQFLFLALHGSRHVWNSLKWICDLGGLLRTQPASACGDAWQRARTLRCERAFLLALLLVQQVTGAQLPDALASRIAEDRRLGGLAAEVYRRLSRCVTAPVRSWLRVWFHLRVRDSYRDGLRYGFCLLVTPTRADWEWLSVPHWFRAVYFPLRLLRLVTRALSWPLTRFWRRTALGRGGAGQQP